MYQQVASDSDAAALMQANARLCTEQHITSGTEYILFLQTA